MNHAFLVRGQPVLVDAADEAAVSKFHWCLNAARGPRIYVVGYKRGVPRKGQALVYLHRLVSGAAKGEIVDHINGNGLDNRRENLRICSHLENTWNRRRSHGRSALLGAQWCEERGLWESSISINRKRHRLGRFPTAAEAHAAYVEASRRLRGEFSPV